MTQSEERNQIIENARSQYRAGEITYDELKDVYYIIAREQAEDYLKGQTK